MVQSTREQVRKPGVHYARTNDGLELPIVDVTHPAFALTVTEEDLRSRVEQFIREPQPLARMPAFARNALLRILLRHSMLGRGIRRAEGGYLSALTTYLTKLGPENLTPPYASPVDLKIAASLPAFSVRLRLQDVASLIADSLGPQLTASANSPVRLVNIAGGTAIDSINALLLLRRDGLLVDRRVDIDVLDRDEEGPAFGARAVQVLCAPGAPLHGVNVVLRHMAYDWNDPSALAKALGDRGTVMVGSSEGGLFEYGSDEAIISNLQCLGACTGKDFKMIGAVTRADEPMQRLRQMSQIATKPRGLDAFRALVARARWQVTRTIERPLSDHVILASMA